MQSYTKLHKKTSETLGAVQFEGYIEISNHCLSLLEHQRFFSVLCTQFLHINEKYNYSSSKRALAESY